MRHVNLYGGYSMEGRASIPETRADPDAFLSGLLAFCADSASACFSLDARRPCVPIGLSCASALLLLLSCSLLVYQRCRHRGESLRESSTFFYSLLGNLCSAVGAVLSRQLHIQVFMGVVAAAVDVVQVISCCLPVLLCWNSEAERRRRMLRGRRRQQLLAVCVLMVIAGGFLESRVTYRPAERPLSKRRLLHVTLQDNTEILGYTLGLLSLVISSTFRFPLLCRVYRGQMLTWAYVLSGLLRSLAGALYAAAILLYDTQFGFLFRVMPWLLSAICCVTLDILILVVHWCKRRTGWQLIHFSPDTESLLGGSCTPTEDNTGMKRQRKQHINSGQTKTKVQKMTEMGRYLDISVQPARKICLKEVTLSKEEVEDGSPNRTVRVIRVDSFCSSDTSCDSSLVSSDLSVFQWDFEEANAQWSKPTAKQQEGKAAPLQPFNICLCAMSGLPQKTGTEEGGSVSPAS